MAQNLGPNAKRSTSPSPESSPAEKEKVVATHFFSAKAATPPQEEGWWTSEKVLVPESYLA